MLRALPAAPGRELPLRLLRPRRIVAVGLLTAVLVAAVVLFLASNTHNGDGPLPQRAPAATPHEVTLCGSCAHDYNPDALYGAKTQNPGLDGYAVDGDRNTAWRTETYYDGFDKKGVGLYVSVAPVAAGSMRLDTATAGYRVVIYASRTHPDADTFTVGAGGWTQVGAAASVGSSQTIRLHTGGMRYRYYLVWITSLGDHTQVAINEVALYT